MFDLLYFIHLEINAGIYTKHIFYIIQDEVFESGFGYSLHMDCDDDNEACYTVKRLTFVKKGKTITFYK